MAVLPCPLDRICGGNGRSQMLLLLLALIAIFLLPAQSRVIRSAATTGNDNDGGDNDDGEFDVDSDSMSPSVVDSADVGSNWERARRSSGRNDYPTGRRRMHVEIQPVTSAPADGRDGSLSLGTWQERERIKQTRLFQIQTQVMNALKLPHRPNVSGRNNFTDEEIEAILAAHENNASLSSSSSESSESADDVIRLSPAFRPVGKPQPVATVVRQRRPPSPPAPAAQQPRQPYPGDASRRTYVLVPTCTIPSRLKSDRYFTLGGANSALRLYFDTETLGVGRVRRHGNRRQETNVQPEVEAANLRIYWRGYNAADVPDSQQRQQQQQPRKRLRTSGLTAINATSQVANFPAPVFAPSETSRSPVPDRRQVRGEDPRRRGNREPRGTKGRAERILEDLGESSAVEISVYQLSKRALARSGGRRGQGQGHGRQRDNDTQLQDQEDDVSRRPLTQMILRHDDIFTAKWLNVDVTSAVDYWLRHPKRNYGLQVVVNALKSGSDERRQRGRSGQRRSPQRASTVDPMMVLHGFDCTYYGKGNSLRGRQSFTASGNRRRTANTMASGDSSNGSRNRQGAASAVPAPTTPSPRTVAAGASSTPARSVPAAAYPNLDVILVLPTSADRSQPAPTRRRGGRRNQGDN